MTNAFSLVSIFKQAQCDFLLFDLSRRVTLISHLDFRAIEENRIPYPLPLKQHAEIGIAFWKTKETPWIWFLRIPLDERGLLTQKALGDFVHCVGNAISTHSKTPYNKEDNTLPSNPYIFTPKEDKKALFHALLTDKLKLPPSQYFLATQHYFSGQSGFDHWEEIGLQGVADLCARIEQNSHAKDIQNALFLMPSSPTYALLGCLEHISLPIALTHAIEAHIQSLCSAPQIDIFLVAACLRGLSGSDLASQQNTIKRILSYQALQHREIYIAIAGRCWSALLDADLLRTFLILMTQENDPLFFEQILSSLVTLPTLRPALLALIHSKDPTPLLHSMTQYQQRIRKNASHPERDPQTKKGERA